MNACWSGSRLPVSSSRRPSIVVTCLPSHSTVSVMQERTGFSSMRTVQQPQAPLSHDTFVPVRPRVSRSVWARVWAGSTAPDALPFSRPYIRPFTVSVIDAVLSRPVRAALLFYSLPSLPSEVFFRSLTSSACPQLPGERPARPATPGPSSRAVSAEKRPTSTI